MEDPFMTVSVVVASGACGEFLFRCLDSLRAQAQEESAEVIVVDRCGGETALRVERDYPFCRLLRAKMDHRPSVPELRKLGVIAAKGDIVAIIEEHCVAPPHWLHAIRNSFQDGDVAIGGPILDGNFHRLRDWIVYFSEYNNYLPPWPDASRYALNGANIAYRREALLAHRNVLGSGYWEVVLHPLLAADGGFRAVSRMGVNHTGPFDFGYYLGQRYLLSRAWGGTQREKLSFAKRLVYLLAAPLCSPSFYWRASWRV
jgi:glycosyltransferase involved in cell wall biosynthesis